MKDTVVNLADGYGGIKRSIRKMEFGTLVLDPNATIGNHGHYDEKNGFKHCEIYITFSPWILINQKRRIIAKCHNAEHEAINFSNNHKARIYFIKLWW